MGTKARTPLLMEEEFGRLTGLRLPEHGVNRLEDGRLRADNIFAAIARLCFDRPETGRRLERRLPRWLKQGARDERTWALAGYVYYAREQYGRARRAFIRAVELRPENLDHWLDLGMTLRHLGDPVGEDILFDFAPFIATYERSGSRRLTPKLLLRLKRSILARGRSYRTDYRRHLDR